jgi:hypothetical protein
MDNCHLLKIYKVDFVIKKGANEGKLLKQRYARINEFLPFKRNLIDKFCSEKFEDLVKYTLFAKHLNIEPKKYESSNGLPLFNDYEIGFDMLYKEYGLVIEYQWSYTYYGVPLVHTEMVKFFDENVPKWVKTVKKI